jgi:hypothetical protein
MTEAFKMGERDSTSIGRRIRKIGISILLEVQDRKKTKKCRPGKPSPFLKDGLSSLVREVRV